MGAALDLLAMAYEWDGTARHVDKWKIAGVGITLTICIFNEHSGNGNSECNGPSGGGCGVGTWMVTTNNNQVWPIERRLVCALVTSNA